MFVVDPSFAGAPRPQGLRLLLVRWLRMLSAGLAALADAAWGAGAPRQSPPQDLEFYSDAGAPEGALYVSGQLVGWLDGVNRL